MKLHLEQLLSGYADGELSPRQRGRVERHLAVCAECRAELESLRSLKQTVTEAASTPEMQVSGDFFWTQLRQRLEKESPQPGREKMDYLPQPAFWQWFRPALAAASIAVFLVASISLYRHYTTPTSPPMQFVQVDEVRTKVPNASAAVFHSPDADVTVIWISGLEPIPEKNSPDEL